MSQTEAVLQVEGLVVQFPGRHGTLRALDKVSFSIAAGEILGVAGESGADKSMTGLAVQQLLEPPGEIAGGKVLLPRLSAIPQGCAFNPCCAHAGPRCRVEVPALVPAKNGACRLSSSR
ncbi:hypothetical protein [Thalassorhabdomicrobium marinisediminis]|uniref:hypothetical protein n=1 Tax=Thalassorhabdomicrobium marinisediminis TaxID=2170577 RepID=UPI0018C89576|nr:hypothetical protein [Thalassorhabdomicrobium marinisediminis]